MVRWRGLSVMQDSVSGSDSGQFSIRVICLRGNMSRVDAGSMANKRRQDLVSQVGLLGAHSAQIKIQSSLALIVHQG